ncbi:spermatogenesis-associated protein 17 [Chytridiales sp. JEL 0842]|nr:spermatogenesis-associated protein 17 [Chytridiales sp. JEL 0842]
MALQFHQASFTKSKGLDVIDDFFDLARSAELFRHTENSKAIQIQARWRGYKARVHLETKTKMVILIQRIFRGYLGRKYYKAEIQRRKREKELKLLNTMATRIQRAWRGHHSRQAIFNFYARQKYIKTLTTQLELTRAQLEAFEIQQRELEAKRKEEYEREKLERLAGRRHHWVGTKAVKGVMFGVEEGEMNVEKVKVLNRKKVKGAAVGVRVGSAGSLVEGKSQQQKVLKEGEVEEEGVASLEPPPTVTPRLLPLLRIPESNLKNSKDLKAFVEKTVGKNWKGVKVKPDPEFRQKTDDGGKVVVEKKAQGPFLPKEVLEKKKNKPLKPSLRVQTDYYDTKNFKREERRQEKAMRESDSDQMSSSTKNNDMTLVVEPLHPSPPSVSNTTTNNNNKRLPCSKPNVTKNTKHLTSSVSSRTSSTSIISDSSTTTRTASQTTTSLNHRIGSSPLAHSSLTPTPPTSTPTSGASTDASPTASMTTVPHPRKRAAPTATIAAKGVDTQTLVLNCMAVLRVPVEPSSESLKANPTLRKESSTETLTEEQVESTDTFSEHLEQASPKPKFKTIVKPFTLTLRPSTATSHLRTCISNLVGAPAGQVHMYKPPPTDLLLSTDPRFQQLLERQKEHQTTIQVDQDNEQEEEGYLSPKDLETILGVSRIDTPLLKAGEVFGEVLHSSFQVESESEKTVSKVVHLVAVVGHPEGRKGWFVYSTGRPEIEEYKKISPNKTRKLVVLYILLTSVVFLLGGGLTIYFLRDQIFKRSSSMDTDTSSSGGSGGRVSLPPIEEWPTTVYVPQPPPGQWTAQWRPVTTPTRGWRTLPTIA